MTNGEHNGVFRHVASMTAQWAANGAIFVIVLPLAIATMVVMALSDTPSDYDQD